MPGRTFLGYIHWLHTSNYVNFRKVHALFYVRIGGVPRKSRVPNLSEALTRKGPERSSSGPLGAQGTAPPYLPSLRAALAAAYSPEGKEGHSRESSDAIIALSIKTKEEFGVRSGSGTPRPPAFDAATYARPNAVERCVNRNTQWRGGTRSGLALAGDWWSSPR